MVAWRRAIVILAATAAVAGPCGLAGGSSASAASSASSASAGSAGSAAARAPLPDYPVFGRTKVPRSRAFSSLVPTVVPGAPTFPATIEAFPRYERENTCSPTAKPGAVELRRILRVTYGSSIASNIVRSCSSKSSGHEEGRAIDWMVSQRKASQAAMGDAFVGWLLAPDAFGNPRAMGRRIGVQYLIWKSRIIMLTGDRTQWTEYSDCLSKRTSKADDTYCHRDHVHVSMTWAGARQQTSWYTMRGLPACKAAGETLVLPVAQRSPTAVTVAATTVLDTDEGIGTPRIAVPCRLASDGTLLIRTAGVGGVPKSGLAEVTLKVTAQAAGLDTEVFPRDPVVVGGVTSDALPDGLERPTLELAAGASGTATWTVRTTSRGDAVLRLGPAVRAVVVQVVGYRQVAAGGTDDATEGASLSPTVSVDVTTRRLPVG